MASSSSSSRTLRVTPFEAGELIAGKYRLEVALGTGATGVVWRATQLTLDRHVAIKLLHPHIANRDDALVRFSREARVAASLEHPASVAVLDFGEDQGAFYFVMELLEGQSLRAHMASKRFTMAESIGIARQVAGALAAAHKIRLVHRDIKPENVIVTPAGAKVVDFGLAFIVDAERATDIGRITAEGFVVGTPAYMSPEQVRGGSIGPPSDVYSLGCVLYELLAGRAPFMGTLGEVFTRHTYTPPIPLRQLDLEIPSALDELVQAMLTKSPASRPTASRVATVLGVLEDPSAERAGRTSAPVIERSMRAVPSTATPERADRDEALELGVIGELSSELELALTASGIAITRWRDDEIGGATYVWASQVPLARLAELAAAGKHILADVAPGDAASIPQLIRAGVVDAIVRPHAADDLVVRALRMRRLRSATT